MDSPRRSSLRPGDILIVFPALCYELLRPRPTSSNPEFLFEECDARCCWRAAGTSSLTFFLACCGCLVISVGLVSCQPEHSFLNKALLLFYWNSRDFLCPTCGLPAGCLRAACSKGIKNLSKRCKTFKPRSRRSSIQYFNLQFKECNFHRNLISEGNVVSSKKEFRN